MVTTYAFVYLPEYVVGVFLPYALKNGRREASFIKGSPMNSESYRPRPKLGCLLWVAWQRTFHQVIPDGVHPARFKHHRGDFSLSMLTEGFRRCSTGISLPMSSCEDVANFAKALAREFYVLGTCLT